jgi:hypothetical protein
MVDFVTLGKNYCLRLPDGRALGHVRTKRIEDPWAEGAFTQAPAFEEYRELFDREVRFRHEQIIPLWEQAADAIETLGIQVIAEEDNTPQPRLRVFVEGNEAILGALLALP